MSSHVWERLRPHWPFTLVAILGLALVLSNLGNDYLWADEGDTAVLAANIIKEGVPKAWNGITFVDSDNRGGRTNGWRNYQKLSGKIGKIFTFDAFRVDVIYFTVLKLFLPLPFFESFGLRRTSY